MIFAKKKKSWCGAMNPRRIRWFLSLLDVLLTTTAHIALMSLIVCLIPRQSPTPSVIPTSLKEWSTWSPRPLQLYEATHRQRAKTVVHWNMVFQTCFHLTFRYVSFFTLSDMFTFRFHKKKSWTKQVPVQVQVQSFYVSTEKDSQWVSG
jgi:hypothetical protein